MQQLLTVIATPTKLLLHCAAAALTCRWYRDVAVADVAVQGPLCVGDAQWLLLLADS